MKSSELRIGNWVRSDEDTIHQIPNGRTIDYYNGWLDPISLTEEWLLKFGFVGSGYFSKDDFIFAI